VIQFEELINMLAYRIIPIVALLILVFGCTSQQSTFYVDNLIGNDRNPGTLDKPFKTIEKVNALSLKPGFSVLLAAG
jgi:hypothetical protein